MRAALDLPVELRHQRVRMRSAGERVPMRAMGRGEHVAVLHRAADAHRDRLLADRHVQEARELAGPKPLLDHLLEPPDQKHLPVEVSQPLLGETTFPTFTLGHGPAVYAAWNGAR